MKEIYFDNAATTAVLESSAKIAYNIMTEQYIVLVSKPKCFSRKPEKNY